MTYVGISLPTHLSRHQQALRELVDPLLSDIHSMLRLPIDGDDGLRGGCNLICALALLSVVAGISETLMHAPGLKSTKAQGGLNPRFKQCLKMYYPWDEEPPPANGTRAVTGKKAAKDLYFAFRNPLTHSLGQQHLSQIGSIKVAKSPLTEGEIEALERATVRPPSWPPTLATDDTAGQRTKTVLNVPVFYWGIRQLVVRTLEGHPRAATQGAPSIVHAGHVPTTSTAGPVTILTNVTVAPPLTR